MVCPVSHRNSTVWCCSRQSFVHSVGLSLMHSSFKTQGLRSPPPTPWAVWDSNGLQLVS